MEEVQGSSPCSSTAPDAKIPFVAGADGLAGVVEGDVVAHRL